MKMYSATQLIFSKTLIEENRSIAYMIRYLTLTVAFFDTVIRDLTSVSGMAPVASSVFSLYRHPTRKFIEPSHCDVNGTDDPSICANL